MTLAFLLRFWWAPVIALVLGFAGVQKVRLDHAKAELVSVKRDLAAMSEAKAASEKLRAEEAKEATDSYSALQSFCTANFQAALSRGRVIERIINAPPNPDGSRGLVGADSLRALLGQEAGSDGEAEGLHH